MGSTVAASICNIYRTGIGQEDKCTGDFLRVEIRRYFEITFVN